MQKLLQNIKSRPPQFRMTLAIVLAVVFTGMIAAGWVWSWSATEKPNAQKNAPSPFNALGQSIKSTVKNSNFKSSSSLQTNTNTQVIDAGAASAAHDETNPYEENQ